MGAKMGFEGKLFRLSTGTRATWGAVNSTTGFAEGSAPAGLDEVTLVVDVTGGAQKGKGKIASRASKWIKYLPGLRDGSFKVKLIYDPADPDFQAFMTSYLKDANLALAILDGDKATVGVLGFWADFIVSDWQKSETLEEGQTVEFTVDPAVSAVDPEFVKVTS